MSDKPTPDYDFSKFGKIIDVCREYVDFIWSKDYCENDYKQYIFQEAMKATYGENIFEIIREKIFELINQKIDEKEE
jgi:hypothetical protein